MKGEKTLRILEAISETAYGIGDFFGAFLGAGYGASYNKLRYEMLRRDKSHSQGNAKREATERYRQRYHSMMYKLKKDGLIIENKKGEKKVFKLTIKGKRTLINLKNRAKNQMPSPSYHEQVGQRVVIVIFDVPERERRKRGWLRSALKSMGLEMVQKSVWIGKKKIPQRFLDDLLRLKIIDFVEIFEVSKTGSLKQLT